MNVEMIMSNDPSYRRQRAKKAQKKKRNKERKRKIDEQMLLTLSENEEWDSQPIIIDRPNPKLKAVEKEEEKGEEEKSTVRSYCIIS